jgi:hypothetical protein
MKTKFLLRPFVALLFCLLSQVLRADLFVEPLVEGQSGFPLELPYVATHALPPDGEFHKVVLLHQDQALAESLENAGSLQVLFDAPGTYACELRVYSTEGAVLDRADCTLMVLGIGLLAPEANAGIPEGSVCFLHAEALFRDRAVDWVRFEARQEGEPDFRPIGASDRMPPYTLRHEFTQTGVLELRATAFHADGSQSSSLARRIQVLPLGPTPDLHPVIVDPLDASALEAGIPGSVQVQFNGSTDSLAWVSLYADGVPIGGVESRREKAPFRFEWTPLLPGKCELTALAVDRKGKSHASAPVRVLISDDRPWVTLRMPAPGTTLPVGGTVLLLSEAAGQGGSRERVGAVQFMVNGHLLPTEAGNAEGWITRAPFATRWTPLLPGTYFVQARVRDTLSGSTALSRSIELHAVETPPPVLRLSAPAAGACFPAGSVIHLSALASSSSGLIQSLHFEVNGLVIEATLSQGALHQAVFQPPQSGKFRVRAVAQDSLGRFSMSPERTFEVLEAGQQAPTVKLMLPPGSEHLIEGESLIWDALAEDPDGQVTELRFLVNGITHGESLSAQPFRSLPYRFPSAGSYRIEAIAMDHEGHQARDSVVLKVQPRPLLRPEVRITLPLDQSPLLCSGHHFMEAAASDPDGHVAEVHFRVDGHPVGAAATRPPYQSAIFELREPGVHRLEAHAIDDQGNLSAKASVVVFAVVDRSETVPDPGPLEDDHAFFRQCFVDLFSRAPEARERDAWEAALTFGGLKRPEVIEKLTQSAEFASLVNLQNAYLSLTGSWPSPDEFAALIRSTLHADEPELTGLTPASGKTAGTSPEDALDLGAPPFAHSDRLDDRFPEHWYRFSLEHGGLITLKSSGSTDLRASLSDAYGNVLAEDDDSGTYFNFAIQRHLLPGHHYLRVSGWAGSRGNYSIEAENGASKPLPMDSGWSGADLNTGIAAVLRSDAYLRRYGKPGDLMANESDRRRFFNQIYLNRFGKPPSLQQTLQASSRLQSSASVEEFVAAFLRNDPQGQGDFIYGMPDYSQRDLAAGLMRSLLKVRPDSQRLEALSGLPMQEQVSRLLSDPAYLARFERSSSVLFQAQLTDRSLPETTPARGLYAPRQMPADFELPSSEQSPFAELEENADGWKHSDWFGWVSDRYYPWVYHSRLGWLRIRSAGTDALWLWDSKTDWSFTQREAFPYLFHYASDRWRLPEWEDEAEGIDWHWSDTP